MDFLFLMREPAQRLGTEVPEGRVAFPLDPLALLHWTIRASRALAGNPLLRDLLEGRHPNTGNTGHLKSSSRELRACRWFLSQSHAAPRSCLSGPFLKKIHKTVLLCFLLIKKIYLLFLAALGLCCSEGFSLVAASGGYSRVVQASRCSGFFCCEAWALGRAGFSSCSSLALEYRLGDCGAWAQLLCSLWDLPGSGIEPVSSALAGGFFTTEPPGKPWCVLLTLNGS